jgi:hypothetical protein
MPVLKGVRDVDSDPQRHIGRRALLKGPASVPVVACLSTKNVAPFDDAMF